MNDRQQLKAFETDLDALCMRYAQEFQLPVLGVIGALSLCRARVEMMVLEDEMEEDDEDGY